MPTQQTLKLEELKLAANRVNDVVFERHDLSIEFFMPGSVDTQKPHDRDEIYIVSSGRGLFRSNGELIEFGPGDFLFVAAGVEHRFERFSSDFRTWVVFFGPSSAADQAAEMPALSE